jgi:hypothetical protein
LFKLDDEETVTGNPSVNDKFLQTLNVTAPFKLGVINTSSIVLENVSCLHVAVARVLHVDISTVLHVVVAIVLHVVVAAVLHVVLLEQRVSAAQLI